MRGGRNHRWSIAALAAWLAAAAALAAQDQPALPAGPHGPSAEQLASWVRLLDADEFLARETAMLQLLDAGPAALPALKPVLSGGSLEATSRALYILRQLGLMATVETRDEAGEMLAELASRKETPALAARAAAALAELTEQRSAQALMELEALGARVNRGQSVFGFVVIDSQPLVEIGESFKGGVMDLARLKWLADVPVVVLSGPRVTDQWLKPALATPGLEQLHLYRTHVSVAGLNELAGHASLKQIGLYYMPIGDEALAALAKLPLLNYVKLYGTQMSSNRVQNFTRDSGISVDYRRGAFLGVGCNDLNGICQISRVHAGSPAERAGLRAQDYIVRFGGTKVTNFESLQTLIGARDIDDEVEIEVIRPASDDGNQYQPLPLKVKLAPWDVEAAVQNPRR